jgi:hypothetical protein
MLRARLIMPFLLWIMIVETAPLIKQKGSFINSCTPGTWVPKIDGPKIEWTMSPSKPRNGDVVTMTGKGDVGNWNNGSGAPFMEWGSEYSYNGETSDPYGDDGLCGHGDKWCDGLTSRCALFVQ